MVGTLPGRTQGLGLITEPLLRDLGGLVYEIHRSGVSTEREQDRCQD